MIDTETTGQALHAERVIKLAIDTTSFNRHRQRRGRRMGEIDRGAAERGGHTEELTAALAR